MWLSAIIIYIILGIMIVRFTRARDVIKTSFDEAVLTSVPSWKITVYFMIIHTASVLLWPLFFNSWFGQKELQNTNDIEEDDLMWPFNKKTKEEGRSALDEVVDLSRKLPSQQKLDIAIKILQKIVDMQQIRDEIGSDVLDEVEIQTISVDREYIANDEFLTPGDLAMMYLFQLQEYVRATGDISMHLLITGTMTDLLGVVPAGSLSNKMQNLPLQALSNKAIS